MKKSELLGVWACRPCRYVLDILTDDDEPGRRFETRCPRCHQLGEYHPSRGGRDQRSPLSS